MANNFSNTFIKDPSSESLRATKSHSASRHLSTSGMACSKKFIRTKPSSSSCLHCVLCVSFHLPPLFHAVDGHECDIKSVHMWVVTSIGQQGRLESCSTCSSLANSHTSLRITLQRRLCTCGFHLVYFVPELILGLGLEARTALRQRSFPKLYQTMLSRADALHAQTILELFFSELHYKYTPKKGGFIFREITRR
eukprot:2235294-Amphidinium_carterae.1